MWWLHRQKLWCFPKIRDFLRLMVLELQYGIIYIYMYVYVYTHTCTYAADTSQVLFCGFIAFCQPFIAKG